MFEHYNVKDKVGTPYYYQTNGQIDVSNKELRRILKKIVYSRRIGH